MSMAMRVSAAARTDGGVRAELLERDELVRAAEALLARAGEGHGGITVFEGPAGSGKSALLRACAGRARGMTVTWWPGGVPGGSIADAVGGREAARPTVLVLDDADAAGDASVAWLARLAPHVAELPLAVLLATRPVAATGATPLAQLLALRDHVEVLPVPPLSARAVRTLVARELGSAAALLAGDRAAAATGGIPFLLGELLEAWRVTRTTDGLPCTPRLRRAVGARLAATGPHAVALAGAIAILGGDDIAVAEAAAVAELSCTQARSTAEALGRDGVLACGPRLSFAHPLVGRAVHDDLPPFERAAAHARAAKALAATGRPPEALAPHLLAASHDGDPWVVAHLRAAARAALARGAPAAAVGLLRRALAEPPVAQVCPDVLRELGEAAALACAPEAEAHLRAALAAARGRQAATIGLALARLLMHARRGNEARAVLGRALADAGDGTELAVRIRAELVCAGRVAPGRGAGGAYAGEQRRAGATAGERLMLASLAVEAVAAGEDADMVEALIRRALHGDALVAGSGPDGTLPYMATAALWTIDRYDEALVHLDLALQDARRRGSPTAHAMARAGRAAALHRAGRLVEAASEALDALVLAAQHELGLVVPLALAPLVAVRVDQGQLELAQAELRDHANGDDVPTDRPSACVRHARGRLRQARGDHEAAAADFLAAGDALVRTGTPSPATAPWRSDAALALAACGHDDRAGTLLAEELALTRRAGAPRALGIALRAAAMLGPAAARAAALDAAAEQLRRAGSQVELARALMDAGVARVRDGMREQGRAVLREALDLADRHHAHAIAARAQRELLVAGARPRRRRLSGCESLTAAELRVARMAADGRSNRDIARELFLSVKTVETHLGHAYSKLDITHRRALATALEIQS